MVLARKTQKCLPAALIAVAACGGKTALDDGGHQETEYEAGPSNASQDAPPSFPLPPESATICTGGTTQCGVSCVDLLSDLAHCGACGRQCLEETICAGGRCLRASLDAAILEADASTGASAIEATEDTFEAGADEAMPLDGIGAEGAAGNVSPAFPSTAPCLEGGNTLWLEVPTDSYWFDGRRSVSVSDKWYLGEAEA